MGAAALRSVSLLAAVGLAIGAAACTTREDPTDLAVRQRFIAVGDGTVRDDLTGLLWAANADLPGFEGPWDGDTWQQALEYVSAMNAGQHPNYGHTDWRLPRVEELYHLLTAFHRPANAAELRARAFWSSLGLAHGDMSDWRSVPVGAFSGVSENAYWSGTAAAAAGDAEAFGPYTPSASDASAPNGRAWVVDTHAAGYLLDKSAHKRVWPVCGASTVTSRPEPSPADVPQ